MKLDLPYLSSEPDRYGNERLYVRRHGKRIRIRSAIGTPEFAAAYFAALESVKQPNPKLEVHPESAPKKGTFGWLATLYFGSAEFCGLDPVSQRTRRGVIEDCLRQKTKGLPFHGCPLTVLTAAKIKELRNTKTGAGLKGAANNRLKYLSAMFSWGIENDKCKANPARDVRRVKNPTDGYHTWTVEEVLKFQERHPVGSKARLALSLLLFLGVRRGDVVRLGRQHLRDHIIRGGILSFVPRKTRHIRREPSHKPILDCLADVMERSELGDMTFLITEYGKPYSPAGFGNRVRDWCNQAGLPHCSAHGLRKAGATLAAENGATIHQLMALYDWSTPGQAEVYTRAADRKRLAAQAMPLLAR